MHILFVEKRLRTDKLGILYLSAILKTRGHTVDMVQDDLDSAETYISNRHTDFVMYSATTDESQWYLDKNRQLKRKHKFISVMGGPHFTFSPEDGLKDIDVDYVVQGPAEEIILNLVDMQYPDKLIKGEIPDINDLPAPDRTILYKYNEFGDARMKRFITSRYCHNTCRYCFNHLYKKLYFDDLHKFNQRVAPDKIIEEILAVNKRYGLEVVYFNDDNFPSNHIWLREFCDKYKECVDLPWCGSMRANSIDQDIVKLMADSGCVMMNIALESANRETQIMLRRGNITNQQVVDACAWCDEYGIKVRLQNMIGLPVADPLQDALDTLKMNIAINPTDSWASIFQPFPKTELWQECIDKHLIGERTQCGNFYEGTPLNIADADKINRLHKWWFFIVKHQLPLEVVKILLGLPLTTKQENELQYLRWNKGKEILYGM